MTDNQLKNRTQNTETYYAVRDMETAREAKKYLDNRAIELDMTYKSIRQRLYEMERVYGRKCSWRRDRVIHKRLNDTNNDAGICLICKRATDKPVPRYAKGMHCFARLDTGYYTDKVMGKNIKKGGGV